MKLVFDLDGVLRDLSGHVASRNGCKYPKTWDEKYNGKTIFQCIDEDLDCLLHAKPTAYLSVVTRHFKKVEIWTNQLEAWRPKTMAWIHNNIKADVDVRYKTPAEKAQHLQDGIILVEDSPNFSNYENILLIDRPYNQTVKGAMRVFGPRHLNNLIELLKEKEK